MDITGLITYLVEDVAEKSSMSEDIRGPKRVFVTQIFVTTFRSKFLGSSSFSFPWIDWIRYYSPKSAKLGLILDDCTCMKDG